MVRELVEARLIASATAQVRLGATPYLHLLGGVRITAGVSNAPAAAAAPGFEGRHHVQALLALAGSTQRGIGRDELVDLLWPQSSAAAGRNRLYHTVHLARVALASVASDGDWISLRNARVVLDERVWCDVLELERASERLPADISDEQLQALVPLCGGVWAPELQLGASGAAGDGARAAVRAAVQTTRARVQSMQGRLLREAVERSQALGDTPALRVLLQNLLHNQPTDEWAHRELMRLDLAAGRRHAVLRTFEKLARELGVQLGLRPSAATVALAAAAAAELQNDAASDTHEPNARALSLVGLVGREALIQDLARQVGQGPGVWNLTGLSGIGKTSLAREVARRVAPALDDGVCLVNLGDLGEFETAASACVRALGLAVSAQDDETDTLVHALQVRQMLLILDDIDAASDAQNLLARLPLASLKTRVIVTSRAAVKLGQAVVVVAVGPLPTPPADATVAQAQQSASYALFCMRCPASGPEQATPAWQQQAVQLVRRLEGLPLAIELAAARTNSMTPGEILKQIERGLHLLGDGPVDLQGRHRSLQASLDWSVNLLSATARSGYGAVAVFAGPFGRADVASLMPAVGLDATAGPALLDELLGAGLLALLPDTQLLRMLHLPRAHARAQAEQRGQWAQVVTARLHEVCRRLDECPLAYESKNFATHLQRVIELEDDAVALLEHAQTHDPRRFVRMVVTLGESWSIRGSVAALLRWGELAIKPALELGMVDEELALRIVMTTSLRARASAATAEQFSQTMLPLFDRADDKVLVARAAAARALTLMQAGQAAHGVALLKRTLEQLAVGHQSDGFWTLATRLAAMGSPLPNVEFNLDALRPRFAGSALWPRMLEMAFRDVREGAAADACTVLADEMVAVARALHSTALQITGLWYGATSQFRADQVSAALDMGTQCYLLARAGGAYKTSIDVAVVVAAWHRYALQADTSQRLLESLLQRLVPANQEAHRVSIPVQHVALLALRGELHAAAQVLLSVSTDWLLSMPDGGLVFWAEAAALLSGLMGKTKLSAELAAALRLLDGQGELIPAVARFRDLHFGADLVRGGSVTADNAALRESLRALLRELHEWLATACKSAPARPATTNTVS